MIRSKLMVAAAAIGLLGTAAAAQTVKTPQGALRGITEGRSEAFKNIPFAAPPVGPLRWKPPQPAKGWSGVRDATRFGPVCMQSPIAPNMGDESAVGFALGDQGPMPQSEDCLNLNVRRPAGTKASAKLPVMIWIYGGGFVFGGGSQRTYTGSGLVRNGVVLVTLNYRLDAFGFLAHPELSAEDPHHSSGNYAMLDAVAAMKWVKANIAAFGGDPNNVTLFGESAGAVSVGVLTGSPLTKGLFNRTIFESGLLFGVPDYGKGGISPGASREVTLAGAEQEGSRWLKQSGAASIADARKLKPEQVLAATLPGPGRPPFAFRPNIDGWFLPRSTFEQLKAGVYSKPVIAGSNNDEGVLFLWDPQFPLAQYQGMIRQTWGPFADKMLAAYPATNDTEALHAARNTLRDSWMGVPPYVWAKHQRGAPVYLYNFDHRPPFPKNPRFDDALAPHAVELPYVFGEMFSPVMAWNKDDAAISDLMTHYWTNFAKTGNPNGKALPRWSPASEASMQSLHFGKDNAAMGELSSLENLKMLDAYYEEARAAAPGK